MPPEGHALKAAQVSMQNDVSSICTTAAVHCKGGEELCDMPQTSHTAISDLRGKVAIMVHTTMKVP